MPEARFAAVAAEDDAAWEPLAAEWSLRAGVTYLNHGSFGPSPLAVQQARRRWTDELEAEPMDFFVRRLIPLLDEVRARLGAFVGAAADDLVPVDNATWGMNVVAASVPLGPGDEVLTNDHEYGAVLRLWEHRCREAGARLVVAPLTTPLTTPNDVVDALLGPLTPRTRLIVVSHVTSPTAIVLPVEELCHRARERGVPVCVDGPHAVAMTPLDLGRLDCDFYTASCHKWLSAPFGSGFLYVNPRQQARVRPVVISWGRKYPPGTSGTWRDEFLWLGTRDPAAILAVPAAIELLESIGLDAFRRRTHALARHARERITALTGLPPLTPDDAAWYGSMVTLPLPPGGGPALQQALWERHAIEVPIVEWNGRRMVRPSCHLYTRRADVDRLVAALTEELSRAG